MSFKGKKHTSIVKYKMSLANQKDRTELLNKLEEYISTLKKNDFPSITSASLHAGISENALLNYEARTEDNSRVRELLTNIRDLQKEKLLTMGLTKRYHPTITQLLLKAHHGLQDTPQNLTQNNIFNISPELLSEAIELSRSKK